MMYKSQRELLLGQNHVPVFFFFLMPLIKSRSFTHTRRRGVRSPYVPRRLPHIEPAPWNSLRYLCVQCNRATVGLHMHRVAITGIVITPRLSCHCVGTRQKFARACIDCYQRCGHVRAYVLCPRKQILVPSATRCTTTSIVHDVAVAELLCFDSCSLATLQLKAAFYDKYRNCPRVIAIITLPEILDFRNQAVAARSWPAVFS